MAMKNPPHPGGIVRRQCLEPLGSTAETWLGMQMAYDLQRALTRADEIEVERFEAA